MGFCNSRLTNEAFMMKLAYGLLKDKDTLWARVLRNKYKCNEASSSSIIFKPRDSNLWKGISQVWPKVLQASKIIQSNGTTSIRWKFSNDGQFTVKFAYNLLVECHLEMAVSRKN